MRAFRYVPMWLKHSPVMATLTSFERDCVFSGQLTSDDRKCLPYDPCALRSEIFPNRPFVGLRQIAAARDKLVARGVWIHKQTPRKEWLEIHPDYRHTEGQNETTFGDEEEPPRQGELLGFAPVVVSRHPRAAQVFNGSRTEAEQNKTKTESRARAGQRNVASNPAPPGKRDSGFGLKEEEDGLQTSNAERRTPNVEPGRFARGVEEFADDEKWASLARALGGREMVENGALWAKRFSLCRDAMVAALSDFLALPPPERKKWNAGAYLTAAFENEKRKWSGAA